MKKIILMSGLFLATGLAFAHSDHAPQVALCSSKLCSKEQVETAVPNSVEMLIKSGKIESSWQKAKVEKVEKKEFKNGPEWVATLLDEKQKDQSKKRLYIFITLKGYLNGSNFSGE